jgi:hypothetical protein
VPAFNALSRTTALIQLGRDVRGDFVWIDFGLGPDKAGPCHIASVTASSIVTKLWKRTPTPPSMNAWVREKNPQIRREGVLVPLTGLEERAQCFTARLYSSGRSMHPLRDEGGFSILYRRREADEETAGTSTAIEGDEQEDGPEGEGGGE